MINKSIGDFFAGIFDIGSSYPSFVSGINRLRIVDNSAFISEPKEYTTIFVVVANG